MTDEYEDDSFDYQEEEEGVDALASMSDIGGPFSREDLINAQQLRTSDYKDVAIKLIKSTNASMELKQALAQWVHSHFTTEVILANNSPRKSGIFKKFNPVDAVKARADLQLEMTYLSADKYDSLQPWYLTLQEDMMFVFDQFLSRSHGNERERMLTGKLTSSQEVKQITESKTNSLDGEKKKRRWF